MDGEQLLAVPGESPVIVAVPELGTEADVISKDRWEQMRQLRAAGHTVSQIARETGADRKTVRACLARTDPIGCGGGDPVLHWPSPQHR